jgi:hypothetical protein
VYGPVRTVVWQGSAGDCRPYADLVGYSEVTAMESSQKQLRILRCALKDSALGNGMFAGLGIALVSSLIWNGARAVTTFRARCR